MRKNKTMRKIMGSSQEHKDGSRKVHHQSCGHQPCASQPLGIHQACVVHSAVHQLLGQRRRSGGEATSKLVHGEGAHQRVAQRLQHCLSLPGALDPAAQDRKFHRSVSTLQPSTRRTRLARTVHPQTTRRCHGPRQCRSQLTCHCPQRSPMRAPSAPLQRPGPPTSPL